MRWRGDALVGCKANDWLVWWQGARQMTDWFGGRGQGKWLTNTVTRWRGGAVVGGKANDWLVWWQGAGGKANDWLVWWQGARQMTDWFGCRGQGKWLTNTVMRWHGDAVARWRAGRGQGKWLTGLVAGGKANDWLVWWQGARQMTD